MVDLPFGAGRLARNPGFTAAVVLTLALGIGANTAIFSVIHAVLLRPLPYPDAERLVTVWERSPRRGMEQERVSGPNYLDWRQQSTVFTEMAVTPSWDGSGEFNLVLPDGTVKVEGSHASASLFSVLGVEPLLGRTLLPEEDRREGNRAAVLGHGLWQRHFGGDPNVIGRTLTVDTFGRQDYTIVGVMPAGFGLPGERELWLPLGWMDVALGQRRSAHWYEVTARLRPGVTLAQAKAEMDAIQAGLEQAHPEASIGSEVVIVPLLHQALGRKLHAALLVLWGVVACVLLIACANVANLMLARTASRRKEIATRLALGAGQWRVMRQLLVESVALALAGGGLGLVLGWAGLEVFMAADPGDIPRLADVTLDTTVLGYTFALTLLVGVVSGIAPAWQLSRLELRGALQEGTRGHSDGTAPSRTRSALVVAEVAVCLVLLSAAGSMLQSFARMLRAERGFDPEHLLTVRLDFSVSGFTTWVRPTATRPQVALQELMERLRAHPGVLAVGAGSKPLRVDNQPPSQTFAIWGRPPAHPRQRPTADFKGISPDWPRALGVSLVRGRWFTEGDRLEAAGVALVNEAFARRYFPNVDPVGQRLSIGDEPAPLDATDGYGLPVWSEIIGVTSDVASLHPQPEVVPEVYRPYWQWPMQGPELLVRTTHSPALEAEAVRREIRETIPSLPPPVIRTMDQVMSGRVAQPRLQTGLLTLFAGLALALSAVGLYAVLARTTAYRRREIGIRLAVGARRWDVIVLLIRQGMKPALAGTAIGATVALALGRAAGRWCDVPATDPLALLAVAVLLMAIALLACWLPARRAAQTDPAEALRVE